MKTKSTKGLELALAEHFTIQPLTLTVIAGPSKGRSYTMTRDAATVGTHRSADFVLADETMSRFHCELSLEGGRPVVTDLKSRNGTLLDGVPVKVAFVRDRSRLTLGHTEIRCERGAEAQIPLSARDRFGSLQGRSHAMRAIFATLERVAASTATILLEGETGTGKEVAAESIHLESDRKEGPFVVVDCGAIAASLAESELFGHERGAFTGADRTRPGAFESASGGTLFLDEIGELSPELQPKLLRALESRKVQRIGSSKQHAVDVRVIAATHRNLKAEVNAKRFRSDLYFRLAVVPVRLPALRERLEDLPLLVDALLERLTPEFRHNAAALRTDAFLAELMQHEWVGNVRELRNYLEACILLSRPPEPHRTAAAPPGAGVDLERPWQAVLEEVERRYVEGVMRAHGNQVSEAAKAAGVARGHFYRMLARHGLR